MVRAGTPVAGYDDVIVVAGAMFRTGAPGKVKTFLQSDGFSGYTGTPCPKDKARAAMDGPRFGVRRRAQTKDDGAEGVPASYWTLENLKKHVHQAVLHYDACGTAERCFNVLHHERGLSCHFIIDVDGTIYQTLDCRERAWHATTSNDASIGIEISNVGAVRADGRGSPTNLLDTYYRTDADGNVALATHPNHRPARPAPVEARIHDQDLRMYDFTQDQYEALSHLLATLSAVLPRIRLRYPTERHLDATRGGPSPESPLRACVPADDDARAGGTDDDDDDDDDDDERNPPAASTKLPDTVLASFEGILGHLHVRRELRLLWSRGAKTS